MTHGTIKIALLASVAANIFLGAFVLGRLTTPGMMPPPFEHADGRHMPPPYERGARDDMHPPPFFGPGKLFSRDEMKANFEAMKPSFDKMKETRKAFAEQLQKGPVTKEEALQHFSEMHGAMESLREQTQEKAAEKISQMPEKERLEFAERLLKERKHRRPH